MLFKLVSVVALASLAVAAPQRAQPPIDVRNPQRAQPPIDAREAQRAQPPIDALFARDARNCKFTTHITEKCDSRPTPTKKTYAKVSDLLTPSMSAVPVPADEQPISKDPLTIHITSRNELIDGDLSIDRRDYSDGQVHLGWKWVNPDTNAPETVTWSEGDDGAQTRYGCRVEQAWSKSGITCDKVNEVEQRDLTLSCFFKCRN